MSTIDIKAIRARNRFEATDESAAALEPCGAAEHFARQPDEWACDACGTPWWTLYPVGARGHEPHLETRLMYRIQSMKADIDSLLAEVDHLGQMMADADVRLKELRLQRDRAQAEIERLRGSINATTEGGNR